MGLCRQQHYLIFLDSRHYFSLTLASSTSAPEHEVHRPTPSPASDHSMAPERCSVRALAPCSASTAEGLWHRSCPLLLCALLRRSTSPLAATRRQKKVTAVMIGYANWCLYSIYMFICLLFLFLHFTVYGVKLSIILKFEVIFQLRIKIM